MFRFFSRICIHAQSRLETAFGDDSGSVTLQKKKKKKPRAQCRKRLQIPEQFFVYGKNLRRTGTPDKIRKSYPRETPKCVIKYGDSKESPRTVRERFAIYRRKEGSFTYSRGGSKSREIERAGA